MYFVLNKKKLKIFINKIEKQTIDRLLSYFEYNIHNFTFYEKLNIISMFGYFQDIFYQKYIRNEKSLTQKIGKSMFGIFIHVN